MVGCKKAIISLRNQLHYVFLYRRIECYCLLCYLYKVRKHLIVSEYPIERYELLIAVHFWSGNCRLSPVITSACNILWTHWLANATSKSTTSNILHIQFFSCIMLPLLPFSITRLKWYIWISKLIIGKLVVACSAYSAANGKNRA